MFAFACISFAISRTFQPTFSIYATKDFSEHKNSLFATHTFKNVYQASYIVPLMTPLG